MRVCKSSQLDPEGYKCDWQDCGLDSAVPDRFFGGCSGNLGQPACPVMRDATDDTVRG
jgi:hypothetical protein